MEDFSNELLFMVFEHLSHTDKVRLMGTCKRWYQCLNTPSVYKIDNFDYIQRLCRKRKYCDNTFRRIGAREVERHGGRLTEVVIPYQTASFARLAMVQIFTAEHTRFLVKLEVGGGFNKNFLEIPILPTCPSTLEVLRLIDCKLSWSAMAPILYTALKELQLVHCQVSAETFLPSTIQLLRVVDTFVPCHWRTTLLPGLRLLEVCGSSFPIGSRTWSVMLVTKDRYYEQPNTGVAPTLSLAFDQEPLMFDELSLNGFDCSRVKSLSWGNATNKGYLTRLLRQCTGLEHLSLGKGCSVKRGFLEQQLSVLAPQLKTLCLRHAKTRFHSQRQRDKAALADRLAEVGIALLI